MAKCQQCGRELTADDIGLYKKMVNRGADSFMCIDCLAEHFHCETAMLRRKIRQFKEQGCMLFPPLESEET